jgi:hypothetical protein
MGGHAVQQGKSRLRGVERFDIQQKTWLLATPLMLIEARICG